MWLLDSHHAESRDAVDILLLRRPCFATNPGLGSALRFSDTLRPSAAFHCQVCTAQPWFTEQRVAATDFSAFAALWRTPVGLMAAFCHRHLRLSRSTVRCLSY